jgi:hypothetical protein
LRVESVPLLAVSTSERDIVLCAVARLASASGRKVERCMVGKDGTSSHKLKLRAEKRSWQERERERQKGRGMHDHILNAEGEEEKRHHSAGASIRVESRWPEPFKQTTSSPETPLPQENRVLALRGVFYDPPGVCAMGMGKSEPLTRLVAQGACAR